MGFSHPAAPANDSVAAEESFAQTPFGAVGDFAVRLGSAIGPPKQQGMPPKGPMKVSPPF